MTSNLVSDDEDINEYKPPKKKAKHSEPGSILRRGIKFANEAEFDEYMSTSTKVRLFRKYFWVKKLMCIYFYSFNKIEILSVIYISLIMIVKYSVDMKIQKLLDMYTYY